MKRGVLDSSKKVLFPPLTPDNQFDKFDPTGNFEAHQDEFDLS